MFMLPEETISLKLVFDNVRNYLVCAAVVAAVAAIGDPQANEGFRSWSWTLTVFAAILIAANALQTWIIIDRLTTRIGRFQKEVRPRWGKFRRLLMHAFLVILIAPALVVAYRGFSVLLVWAIRGGK